MGKKKKAKDRYDFLISGQAIKLADLPSKKIPNSESQFLFDQDLIIIDEKLNTQCRHIALLHELIHGYLRLYGGDLFITWLTHQLGFEKTRDEIIEFVDQHIAGVIYGLVVLNPDLFRAILEGKEYKTKTDQSLIMVEKINNESENKSV